MAKEPGQRYVYDLELIEIGRPERAQAQLNARGADGWRIVACLSRPNALLIVWEQARREAGADG